MYDFKTFAQMNLDLIFQGVRRLPEPGEEVFADTFTMQLGGGPAVPPIVLSALGYRTCLGTFMGEDEESDICRRKLANLQFTDYKLFPSASDHPVVVTSVFSWEHDRGFLAYNNQVREDTLDSRTVYDFLKDAKVVFAPVGHPEVTRRLHEEGVTIVCDTGWDDNLSVEHFQSFLPFVDVYTPNDKEAMKMTKTSTPEDALRVLANYTPHPVVTLGKGGCAWWEDGAIHFSPAIEAFTAVDTTGAGDNFLTGIIYGLINREPLAQCMRLGNIFAGYSTTGLGCYGKKITPELIEKYR